MRYTRIRWIGHAAQSARRASADMPPGRPGPAPRCGPDCGPVVARGRPPDVPTDVPPDVPTDSPPDKRPVMAMVRGSLLISGNPFYE